MSPRLSFFFFQAEDGIRALYVTGVQTCALPISLRLPDQRHSVQVVSPSWTHRQISARKSGIPARSEERRVGKECRSRWTLHQSKKTREGRTERRALPVQRYTTWEAGWK